MRAIDRDEAAEKGAEDDMAIPAPEETFLALSRRDYVVRRYPLAKTQFELLSALAAGATVEDALAEATTDCGLDDDALAAALHQWFAVWTADQFFAGVSFE
jgi:hypothetical protein